MGRRYSPDFWLAVKPHPSPTSFGALWAWIAPRHMRNSRSFLSDQSLTPPQIRFIEMVIDQLVARGVMEASALYEPPFSNLHAGGPDELFAGQENVIEGIFDKLKAVHSELTAKAG